MGILILNLTFVTADVVEKADVPMEGQHHTRGSRAQIDSKGHSVVDAAGLVLPGGIDAHTHMDMPFGGRCPLMTFSPARGLRLLADDDHRRFRNQAKGTRMRDALDIWRAKAEGARLASTMVCT
jgi:dihydropyrimidinase